MFDPERRNYRLLQKHQNHIYRRCTEKRASLTNFKKISIRLYKIKRPRTTVIDSPLYIHANKHIYPYSTFICIYMGNCENIRAILSLHAHWMRIQSPHNIRLKVCSVILSNPLFLTRSVKLHVLTGRQFPETFCNGKSLFFFLELQDHRQGKKKKSRIHARLPQIGLFLPQIEKENVNTHRRELAPRGPQWLMVNHDLLLWLLFFGL